MLNKLSAPLVKKLASTLKVNELIEKEQSVNNTLKYVIPANRKAVPKTAPKTAPEAAPKVSNAKQASDSKAARIPRTILKALPRSAALPHTSKELTKPLELAMVGAAFFQYLTKQKGIEIFGVSMRDLEYKLNKAKKSTINPATAVLECYHKFLNMFLKEASDKVFPSLKYDHKIKLVNDGKNYSQAAL